MQINVAGIGTITADTFGFDTRRDCGLENTE